MLVERWLTSSFEDRESALISRRNGVPGFFEWRGKTSFHKHLKRNFPLGICVWEAPCVLCFKRNGPRGALIRKKSKFPCRGFMHAHHSYHKMKRCLTSVETLQKALGFHLISKRGLTSLWQLESNVVFTASNVDNAWQFFNIVRNPNVTVSNRKRDPNSHLTSRSVHIVLSRLVYIPEVSLIPRQVFWLHWTDSSFEWISPP